MARQRRFAPSSTANPAWPDRGLLTQRAEEALFNSAASAARHQGVLRRRPAPHRRRHRRAGVRATWPTRTRRRPRRWRRRPGSSTTIPASLEPAFLKRVGALLTEADHKRRLDRLLFNDSRWTGERNERAAVIRRVIALLSEDEKKKAEARLAVFLRAKNSNQLLSKLPAHSQTDWGLAVQKAQALRRQKKDEEAWKILLAEPGSTCQAPDGWWEERRANAYAALKAGKPKTAYELVRNPGPLSVNASKDASFLAGWLALRHLNDAKLALGHFEALAEGRRRPAEPRPRPILAGPHLRGARRQGQGAGALQGRVRLLRHLPRPAGAPQGRCRRAAR